MEHRFGKLHNDFDMKVKFITEYLKHKMVRDVLDLSYETENEGIPPIIESDSLDFPETENRIDLSNNTSIFSDKLNADVYKTNLLSDLQRIEKKFDVMIAVSIDYIQIEKEELLEAVEKLRDDGLLFCEIDQFEFMNKKKSLIRELTSKGLACQAILRVPNTLTYDKYLVVFKRTNIEGKVYVGELNTEISRKIIVGHLCSDVPTPDNSAYYKVYLKDFYSFNQVQYEHNLVWEQKQKQDLSLLSLKKISSKILESQYFSDTDNSIFVPRTYGMYIKRGVITNKAQLLDNLDYEEIRFCDVIEADTEQYFELGVDKYQNKAIGGADIQLSLQEMERLVLNCYYQVILKKDLANNDYLLSYFKSNNGKGLIETLLSKSSEIKVSDLSEANVLLPDIEAQNKLTKLRNMAGNTIAAYNEQLMDIYDKFLGSEAIDELINTTNQVFNINYPEAYKEKKQELYQTFPELFINENMSAASQIFASGYILGSKGLTNYTADDRDHSGAILLLTKGLEVLLNDYFSEMMIHKLVKSKQYVEELKNLNLSDRVDKKTREWLLGNANHTLGSISFFCKHFDYSNNIFGKLVRRYINNSNEITDDVKTKILEFIRYIGKNISQGIVDEIRNEYIHEVIAKVSDFEKVEEKIEVILRGLNEALRKKG